MLMMESCWLGKSERFCCLMLLLNESSDAVLDFQHIGSRLLQS